MEKILQISEEKCCVCGLDFNEALENNNPVMKHGTDKITDNGLVFEFCNPCFKKACDLAQKLGDGCKSWQELVTKLKPN